MSNTLLSPTVIAKEVAMQVENQCVLANNVHRQFKKEFVKIGDTVTVEKPLKFVANDGADITSQIQDVTEQSTTLQIGYRKNVAWKFSAKELTLNIKDYSEKYIKPALIPLCNSLDTSIADQYKYIPYAAGTAGTTPSTFANLGAAAQNLDENSIVQEDRRIVFDPAARWSMADAFKNFYDAGTAKRARKGLVAEMAGFGKILMDQNIAYHTAGATAGTTLVNGAGQTGDTLEVDGFTAATAALKAGDVFTIEDVYHVNPVSKESTGKLQQFTVTADTAAVSNSAELPISPSIITSGAYQTVSAGPGDGAAVTFLASHKANLAFHKNAFSLVTVPIEIPDSVKWSARTTHNGLSVRIIKGYDILKDEEIIRLDLMWGVKTIYPEMATRLLG